MSTIRNWNHAVSFSVSDANYKTPNRIEDVQDIVKHAFHHNIPVTVLGSCHSATACMAGTGITISMKQFDRILSVDSQNLTVTVQAGVTLSDLVLCLKEHGLQPPVVMEFGNYHIGAICGTHANDTATKEKAQFSSSTLGVKLVTPTGEVMEISQAQHSELLPAVRSHFGLFGVVCEVTLRVLRTKPLKMSVVKMDLNSFLDDFNCQLRSLKTDHDQVFGMLCPYSSKVFWQCRKFIEPVASGSQSLSNWKNRLAAKNSSTLIKTLIKLITATTPTDCSTARAKLLSSAFINLPLSIIRHVTYVIDPCDRGTLYGQNDARFDFYDWAFPELNWCDMTRSFLQLCSRFKREHNFGLSLPVVIYFIQQDQTSSLSRSSRANLMVLDPLHPNVHDPKWKQFRLEFNKIAMGHGGIPHINKTRDGAIYHFAEACDPDALRAFLELRQQFDPKDLFLNEHFRQMFAEYL